MATKHSPCTDCGATCRGTRCAACHRKHLSGDVPGGTTETFESNQDGDILTIRSLSDAVTTVEQAIEKAKVDTVVWAIDKQRVTYRQTGNIDGSRQLVSIDLRFKRKVPERVELALDAIFDRMRKHRPQYRKANHKPVPPKMPCMLEFSPFDMHFGKLAWRQETGEDYDLDIAERSLSDALRDVMDVAGHYPIEKFYFPVGSDWFHIDNMLGETVKGTPQDTDGRWPKIFNTGYWACVKAIDRMRTVAPVTVAWVPGNHDWTTSWYLIKTLEAHYREVDAVRICCDPTPRRYVKYGTNLIGFTHGNEEKHNSLPALMATEKPQEWADTTHHEWHVGDQHRKRQMVHTAVDTHDGVVVRVLPSLSGRDAWHAKKGYLSQRVAEAYLWGKSLGYLGHFAVGKQRGIVG